MEGKTPTTINTSDQQKCTSWLYYRYVLHNRIKRLSCLNRRRNIRPDSFALPHLAIIYFAPFHASFRHVQTCQLQKQTDPAKTGLVRCLVSKSHGSEVCNCRVQRVFFSLLAGYNRSFATKKKPSGTQGNFQAFTIQDKRELISSQKPGTGFGICLVQVLQEPLYF